MSQAIPVFVVVGNVNQGKSSVVAALTEDEAVPIDSYPGTTKRSAEYVFRAGDRALFRIVDTPGFQNPRQVLARLRARATNAGERPGAVRAFVDSAEARAEFRDEAELLRPILEGAGILYVVDSSSALEPASEAEMEILRWTGQPAMALLNRVRDRDHAREWLPVLRQFFHVVREFDAHRARFPDRLALLRAFREIRPEWSESIDAAVAAMEQEARDRARRAAATLADLVVGALGHVERRPLPESADQKQLQAELESAYRDAQRRLEKSARDTIESIHRHPGLGREDPEVDLLADDLFGETTWRVLGLSRAQLLRYAAAGGAVAGGAIDLAVGGLSFLAGTAIGAAAGAVLGWTAGTKVASTWSNASRFARALFPGDTGRFVAMGPVSSARYAWVLLDRALVHYRAVRDRSHARRDALQPSESRTGIVATLDASLRDDLDRSLRKVLGEVRSGGSVGTETRKELEARLLAVMARIEPRV